MLRGKITNAPIVNPDQIVLAPPWVSLNTPVQQDNRDARFGKCKCYPLIGLESFR